MAKTRLRGLGRAVQPESSLTREGASRMTEK
jgi:hypothetical protein